MPAGGGGLVTDILRGMVGALLATEILTLSSEELMKVVEFTVISVPEKVAVAPDSKYAPVTSKILLLVP